MQHLRTQATLKADLSDKEELTGMIQSFKDLNRSAAWKEMHVGVATQLRSKHQSKSILKSSPPGRGQSPGATKNKVIIFDESQRLLSDSSEEAERPQKEQTTIQKQFPFYSSRSKHGSSAAEGALRNKRPVHVVPDEERKLRSNRRETKARLDSFGLLQKVDDQARDLYDKLRIYPKTHQDQAM